MTVEHIEIGKYAKATRTTSEITKDKLYYVYRLSPSGSPIVKDNSGHWASINHSFLQQQ